MKVKYVLEKSGNKQLVLQEYSATDKKDFSLFTLLCEEAYDEKTIVAAISNGERALIDELRTLNFYPLGVYAGKIADLVMQMYGPDGEDSMEIVLDDSDLLTKQAKERELLAEIEEALEEEPEQIDDLLSDDDTIKNLKTTIQVADDEAVDLEKGKIDDDLMV